MLKLRILQPAHGLILHRLCEVSQLCKPDLRLYLLELIWDDHCKQQSRLANMVVAVTIAVVAGPGCSSCFHGIECDCKSSVDCMDSACCTRLVRTAAK